MNLRIFAEQVEHACALTAVEQVGLDAMTKILPERPTSGMYAHHEESGYAAAYDIMIPDVDYEDAEEYSDWLRDQTMDFELRRACLARYIEIEKLCTRASMDPVTLSR